MKILLEFELSKDEPNITDLIAGRVYMMDCINKHKDVTATIYTDEFISLPVVDVMEQHDRVFKEVAK